MMTSSSVKLHVFDLDHTLLKSNCSLEFGKYFYQKKFISTSNMLKALSYYFRHKAFGLPLINTHQNIFKVIFFGQSLDLVQTHAENFLSASLEHLFFQPVLARLKLALKNQEHVVILSSSPQFLVKPIAKTLMVNEWKSSYYETDVHQCFSRISYYVEGDTKRQYIVNLANQLGIPLHHVVAYSDSHLDLPLLEKVGRPIGVQPDKILRKKCRNMGWEIL